MATILDAARAPPTPAATPAVRGRRGLMALYLMLGFSAGLPFYMFNATLLYRLARHGVDVVTVGYFAWVALLPTFKFLWAPLLDRYAVPGLAGFWGKRRGWIMLAQLGIVASLAAMALTASDASLALTALFATLLAFWTTTLEVAADAWRIELAPTAGEQGPLVAANLWGYRSAMVAASGGAIWISSWGGGDNWPLAYGVIALAAAIPLPILAAMRPAPARSGGRGAALATGLAASAVALLAVGAVAAVLGWAALRLAGAAGVSAATNVTVPVLVVALSPFVVLAALLPTIRRLPPTAPARRSAAIGPYVDLFWRYGYAALPVLAFVSVYRMGDVMALTLSHPMFNALGYQPGAIGVADSWVTIPASMAGVALGGWLAARAPLGRALAVGALVSAVSNWVFAWLAYVPPAASHLYLAMAVDQFGHGFAGAVFVIYLSLLVNPRWPGAQYAFLSGFAFLLPRLLAGASGSIELAIGYDGFFLMTGAMSLCAVVFLPFAIRARPRDADD